MDEKEISNIIDKIRISEDEKEVRSLTERYSKENKEIYNSGITRWGELAGMEGQVVGFEVSKEYAIDALIRESSLLPVDGEYRTRSVKKSASSLGGGKYVDDFETMGEEQGFKAAFKVVNQVGSKLYGDKFTPEFAKVAFKTACPYSETDQYLGNVENWFNELNNKA